MNLYTLVQEQAGTMLSQTIGYVSGAINLVRNYTTQPLFGSLDSFDAPPGQGVSGEEGVSETPMPPISTRSYIRSIIWRSIFGFLALIIATFVANDMIFLPWPVRILGYVSVLLASQYHPIFFTIITLYYIFFILSNLYNKKPNILPVIYTLLPLRTAKGPGVSFFLQPFTYFLEGPDAPFHKTFLEGQGAYVTAMAATIPGYGNMTTQLVGKRADFVKHLDEVNSMERWKVTEISVEDVAKEEAEELLENETRTAFQRVGKTRGELEEASKGLSKGLFGASKEAKEAADKAEVKLEMAKRAFADQKAAEKQKMEGLDYTKSNEAKQIFETHRLESEAEYAVTKAKATKETTKPTGSNQSIRDAIKTVEQASFQAQTAVEEARAARAALDAKTPIPKPGVDELRNKADELERQADSAQREFKEATRKAPLTNTDLDYSQAKQDRYREAVQARNKQVRVQGLAEAARAKARDATAAEAANGSEKYIQLQTLNAAVVTSAAAATAAKGAVATAEAAVAKAEKDIQVNKVENPKAALEARIKKQQAEQEVAKTQKAAAAAEQKLQQARAAAAQRTAAT